MKANEALRIMLELGCQKVRQEGSRLRIARPCGEHHTTVSVHAGEELGSGLQRAIERNFTPCLGKGWLR